MVFGHLPLHPDSAPSGELVPFLSLLHDSSSQRFFSLCTACHFVPASPDSGTLSSSRLCSLPAMELRRGPENTRGARNIRQVEQHKRRLPCACAARVARYWVSPQSHSTSHTFARAGVRVRRAHARGAHPRGRVRPGSRRGAPPGAEREHPTSNHAHAHHSPLCIIATFVALLSACGHVRGAARLPR